jgi:hypothetical protein
MQIVDQLPFHNHATMGGKITEDSLDFEVLPVGIVVATIDGDNPADLGMPGTWEAI